MVWLILVSLALAVVYASYLVWSRRLKLPQESLAHIYTLDGENEDIAYGIAYTVCGRRGCGATVSKCPTVHPKSAMFHIHSDQYELLLKLKDLVTETEEFKRGDVRNAFSKGYTKMDELLSKECENGLDSKWMTACHSMLVFFKLPLAHIAAGFPIDTLAIRNISRHKIFRVRPHKDIVNDFVHYQCYQFSWCQDRAAKTSSINTGAWVPGCADYFGVYLDKEQYLMFKPSNIGVKWTDEFVCDMFKKAQERGWTLSRLCEQFLLNVDYRYEFNEHTALCIVRMKQNTTDHKWPKMKFLSWLRLKLAGLGFPVKLSCEEHTQVWS